ncbi:excinuclease ABC subunit UvrA [Singulisphaera acidiphila]|uniref:UvrABC system protein A n=1 Tax=Singulisphaera acidiphila (strain ATCC BAA-1392 / DSM 18658 / VKM B-2454 / MOB10) TaxID=886293 RepID=L0DN94_SINAD|nr:excinuclease ABC subunit UvrA [Singulisphaera acidiphila]AGA30844.1 excinuclease ABC, A subunit [Singulisphaera acidiphila DSM 18658]
MATTDIVIRGAREHNLRDVSLNLPRGSLICFTGVSGSGKSSLAFDTLYAEGQRRYVESLSSYARQFLGQMPKPEVDRIEGLSPSISIQQKTGGRNPRSTVGTITEINDYLRVLFARVGQGHCPKCDRPVAAQTREQIIARVLDLPDGTAYSVLAPVIRGQKGEYKDLFGELARAGYMRARVNGQVFSLSDNLSLDRQTKHHIEVVIDRLKAGSAVRPRLAEAIESALKLGDGTVIITRDGQADLLLSSHYACASCGLSFDPPSPQLFSFNSPQGMCTSCDGLGIRHDFDPALLVPDPSLSVWKGAIEPLGPISGVGKWRKHLFEGVAANVEADEDGPPKGTMLKGPWGELDPRWQHAWLYGLGDRIIVHRWKSRKKNWSHTGTWDGVATDLMAKYRSANGGPARSKLEPYMRSMTCPECQGTRLNPRARAVRVGGTTLVELGSMPIGQAAQFFDALAGEENGTAVVPLDPLSRTIADELLKEIRGRLGFLTNVGLHYLALDRAAPTLSGGEAQRIRLASQVGAGLVGVLYILDEPSIGLHPRDNDRLIATLQRLRDVGNTVIVVEHDEDTMRAADHLVDFGPGPGVKGGEVVAEGSIAKLAAASASLTGQYLSGRRAIEVPKTRRVPDGRTLKVVGARQHNLRGIDVEIPLGLFVCVTGVSGSGKSSLIGDILRDTLARDLNGAITEPGAHDRIEGVEHLDKIIDIDQSPIGRTPRSNPATYIKLFDLIRDLYTRLPDAKARGYKAGRFSFNVEGGRCEACQGNGSNRLEMDFLADVWVTCPVCEGKRFNRETLHARFKGKSISDVLEMDVQEALEHFANVPKISGMLQTLHDVGLDYLKLGQASPTLSGGEAQRIKLARELVKRGTGRTLYILDEPTTGLHFEDVRKLLEVLHGFTALGNTVVVIEHNLDVIKTADWLIDMGPEGGAGGGQVVAEGAPEQVAAVAGSHTGAALAKIFNPPKPSALRKTGPAKRGKRKSSEDGLASISVRGARQHNLKGIDVDLPRHKMSVCSGPSGSGKSSFAIDTLYAEGQRRYVESLSSYARQFLAPLQKPKVEGISGLSPAVSIEQKTTSKSPRSTVGTVTEIHDYLRILLARLGQPYCPSCGLAIGTQTADEIVEKILHLPEGTKIFVMAPVERRDGEQYDALWDELRATGFARVRVDGRSVSLDTPPKLSHRRKHRIEVVIDRAVVRRSTRSRLADSVESALDLGKGVALVARVGEEANEQNWPVDRYSQHRSCDGCGRSFEELSPHHFSFNSSLGWCPVCEGLGIQHGANPAVLIPDGRRSLRQGAVAVWPDFGVNPLFGRMIAALTETLGIDLDVPFDDLEGRHRRTILHGAGDAWFKVPEGAGQPEFSFQYKGLFPAIEEAGRVSFVYRFKLQGMVDDVPCASCMGARLRDDAAAVRFHDFTLDQIGQWPLGRAYTFFKNLKLSADEKHIAGDLIREIRDRLKFLVDVGLDYLSLGRGTPTLSGGESQRIRLASQIGSGLTGVLYVLDEPTIGLHPRDNARLLKALRHLRDLGNTLVLVEHDREVIEAADYLVDFGPGSGSGGGEVTGAGTPAKVKTIKKSLTGQYLSGKTAIPVPTNRRPADGPSLWVRGARHHNLKNLDVRFPLGIVTVVTGVSGSGKSSLVEDILWKAAAKTLHRAQVTPGAHDAIEGLTLVDKVISVDQTPLGSTPTSTPGTYSGTFDLIRELYAKLPESKVRGFTSRRFSFNQAGGRCEACEGAGQRRIEMHFLPDVWVTCEACGGARYTPETLAVKFRGKTIADVLEMNVDAALELFDSVPKIKRILQTLHDVGLGYIPLGQSAPTLSGGEAQRVKLAAELARPDTGKTLYILDEPTTGLHLDDVRKLLAVVHRLADLGNTVVIIEHNLEVIKTADWLIDIGPEAGGEGGEVVAAGPPETIAETKGCLTGLILKDLLAAGPYAERPKYDRKAEARKALAETKAKAASLVELNTAVKPPWELDGRRWHTLDRVGRSGRPARWDGRILERVVDRIQELGTFLPTDWSQRTAVRILADKGITLPFFHALTSSEWIVTLRFNVRRNTFKPTTLARDLGLLPFHEGATPVHSQADRLIVTNQGTAQEIVLTCHSASDLETPAFDAFLVKAVESYGRIGESGGLVLASELS